MMRTEAEIREKLARIERDPRMRRAGGPPVPGSVAAERAAVLNQFQAAIWTLEWVLGKED